MIKRLVYWLCPAFAEWVYGSARPELPAAVCDSMDAVRRAAAELLDGMDAAAEQAWDTSDYKRMEALDALAGYLEGQLQRFRQRHSSDPLD